MAIENRWPKLLDIDECSGMSSNGHLCLWFNTHTVKEDINKKTSKKRTIVGIVIGPRRLGDESHEPYTNIASLNRRRRLWPCRPIKQLPHITCRSCVCRLLRLHKQTAAIQVLKISTSFGILKWRIKKVLYFRNGLEVVRNLEPLHVLDDTRKLIILVEVQELLVIVQRRSSMRRITLSTKRYIREIQTKKGNSRWWGVPKSWTVLMVIPTVVCKLPKRLKLRLGFLRYTSPSLMQTSYRRRVQCSQNWSRSRIVI